MKIRRGETGGVREEPECFATRFCCACGRRHVFAAGAGRLESVDLAGFVLIGAVNPETHLRLNALVVGQFDFVGRPIVAAAAF